MRRGRSVSALLFTSSFALLALLPSPALALLVDFDSVVHGGVIEDQLDGITITATNPNRAFDIAAAFDTNESGTSDPDLEANLSGSFFWSAGNIAQVDLGRILILQEDDDDCSTDVCSDPDDEGERPAGEIDILLTTSVLDFGFDLVDVESILAEAAFIRLYQGDDFETVALMDYLDTGSARYDPTIVLGDNSANRFAPITAESLGFQQIDRVAFELGGSSGIDNLRGTAVPEPSSAALVGLGLGALALARRRTSA
jgi:hypothetical protein